MLILLSGIPRKCGHIRKLMVLILNTYLNTVDYSSGSRLLVKSWMASFEKLIINNIFKRDHVISASSK